MLSLSKNQIPPHLLKFFKPRHVLKPKDDAGIPWRVAFALQADGWYLRSEITWCKRNPMPESVSDRPTSATEKIFLLSKSPRYFFDAEAVREGFADERMGQDGGQTKRVRNVGGRTDGFTTPSGWTNEYGNTGRNVRNFWLLSSEPFPGAHFATFPTEIPRRAIKAGTSEAGCCSVCGKPWERVVTCERMKESDSPRYSGCSTRNDANDGRYKIIKTTTGFRPTCDHDAPAVPCIVLDPFNGSGTTGLVCQQLGRRYIGLDLSLAYLQLSRERLGMVALEEWQNGKSADASDLTGLPLFAQD
jgi:hypothetical protein